MERRVTSMTESGNSILEVQFVSLFQHLEHNRGPALLRAGFWIKAAIRNEFSAPEMVRKAPQIGRYPPGATITEAVIGFEPVERARQGPILLPGKAHQPQGIGRARSPIAWRQPDRRAIGRNLAGAPAEWEITIMQVSTEIEAGLQTVDRGKKTKLTPINLGVKTV